MQLATYRFLEFELDLSCYELRRNGELIPLPPKAFDLLLYLVENSDRVVPKSEIFERVWSGQQVVESALTKNMSLLRQAVTPRTIQTVRGRGYRLAVPVAVEGNAPSSPQTRPASLFVGRDALMRELVQVLESTMQGRGQVQLLAGDAGIGKTRTAEELCIEAKRRGALVLWARAHEVEGSPPFNLWVQVLRDWVEEEGPATVIASAGAGAGDLTQLLPELAEFLPESVEISHIDPEQARFRLFEAWVRCLRSASRTQPIVLVLDDLQWADLPSMRLLSFAVSELAAERVLILGTHRDIVLRRGHALGRALGELVRQRNLHRTLLRGLERAEVQQLISEITTGSVDEPLIDAIYEMTDGNPFFIREMVELMESEEPLSLRNPVAGWRSSMPQGVREAIGRRLENLSDDCNHLLSLASVLGREFDLRILVAITHWTPEKLIEGLDEAVGANILYEDPKVLGRYGFSHSLIAQSVYADLPTSVRVRLHREAADALVYVLGAAMDQCLGEIASHYFQAALGGTSAKAVEYAVRAAEQAFVSLAFEDAAQYYDCALAALDLSTEPRDVKRCQILLAKGDAEIRAGESETSAATFGQTAELARKIGRPDLFGLAALGACGREEGLHDGRSVCQRLEEALEWLSEDELVLRSRMLSQLAITPPYSDSLEQRNSLSREALALAYQGPNRATLIQALRARAFAMIGPDHVDPYQEIGNELLRLGGHADDSGVPGFVYRDPHFQGRFLRYRSFLVRGSMVEARRELELLGQIASRLRQPIWSWELAQCRASLALSEGALNQARELIEEAREIGRPTQFPWVEMVYRGQMLWLGAECGESQAIEGNLNMTNENPWALGAFSPIAEAMHLANLRNHEEARSLFETATRDGLGALPKNEFWLMGMAFVARVCWVLRDHKRAGEAYELLRPYEGLCVVPYHMQVQQGSVHGPLGVLAAAKGDASKMRSHFESAIERNHAMGVVPATIDAHYRFAQALLRLGGTRERNAAKEQLARAEILCQERGLKPRLARICRLQARAR